MRVAQGGEMLVPGDGSDPIQIIDGRDLGEWMIRLAEAGTTGTFNAVGPEKPLTTTRCCTAARRVTGGKPTLHARVTANSSKNRRSSCRSGCRRTSGPYAGYGAVSNARAIAAGLTFRPLATTVTDLLAWFRSQPAERQATLRAGITREQEAELLKAWHARKVG